MTTVGFGRAEITDWQPLYRLGAGYVALWVGLSLAAIVGVMHAWRARTWDLRRLAVVAMLAVGSFQVSRLEAFFAIAVVLLLGPDIAAALSAWRKPSAAPQAPRKGFATAFAIAIVVAALLLLVQTDLAFGIAGGDDAGCQRQGAEARPGARPLRPRKVASSP